MCDPVSIISDGTEMTDYFLHLIHLDFDQILVSDENTIL
jgi:hypothetical protein